MIATSFRRCVISFNYFNSFRSRYASNRICKGMLVLALFTPIAAFAIYQNQSKLTMKKYSVELIENGMISCDEKRTYFIPRKIDDGSDFLIYLHGLEVDGTLSEETKDKFYKIAELAQKANVVAVFPLGNTNNFPQNRSALAWAPDINRNNRQFLKELYAHLRSAYKINRVFLGGFSNGASIISEAIQCENESPFDGYLLQSGGYKKPLSHDYVIKPVVIEVGTKDEWHYSVVKAFSIHLEHHGWKKDHTLKYIEYSTKHVMVIDGMTENLQFLKGEKRSNL